jgi:hypothetical protein
VQQPDLGRFAAPFSLNDTLRAAYGAPLVISNGLILEFKSNVSPGENSWELRNSNGEIVAMGNDLLNNTTYRDTLNLEPGCYEFQFLDAGQDGLSWWANTSQGNGSLRFRNASNGIIKTFNPDFGGEVSQQFVFDPVLAVNKPQAGLNDLSIYPNPAKGILHYEIELNGNGPCRLEVTDMQGRTLLGKVVSPAEKGLLDISSLPAGLYQLVLVQGESRISRRFSCY